MAYLNHVCVWDDQEGYRRVTAEEAEDMFPLDGVSANSGMFVCELCGQNVTFSSPGKRKRHFKHNNAAQNKECEERKLCISKEITAMNHHVLPIRLVRSGNLLSFELGFILPPPEAGKNVSCKKIKIVSADGRRFEYEFGKLTGPGVTYLSVGRKPSTNYTITYEEPTEDLMQLWPVQADGIPETGAFFNQRGKLLREGTKAMIGSTYFLVLNTPLVVADIPEGLEVNHRRISGPSGGINLYEVVARKLTEKTARFFLDKMVFLAETGRSLTPVWPPCEQQPYHLFHNHNSVFILSKGTNAESKVFPDRDSRQITGKRLKGNTRLYRVQTTERDQLLSVGPSGTQGFMYLMRRKPCLNTENASVYLGDVVQDDKLTTTPASIRIESPYNGRVELMKEETIVGIYAITGGTSQFLTVESGVTALKFYCGNDLVRTVEVVAEKPVTEAKIRDKALLFVLQSCGGREIPFAGTKAGLGAKLRDYPRTKRWVNTQLHRGCISKEAYAILYYHIMRR